MPFEKDGEILYTKQDVADLVDVSLLTVRKWASEGLIKAIGVMKTPYTKLPASVFREQDVFNFLKERYGNDGND